MQYAQARARCVDERPVEACQLGRQVESVGLDDANVGGPEPGDVLLELTSASRVHLDGYHLAASWVALPPGAAQRSSIRSPSRAPTQSPASADPRLWGQIRPSARAARRCGRPRRRSECLFRPRPGRRPDEPDNEVAARSAPASERARLPRPDPGATRPDPVRIRVLERPLRQSASSVPIPSETRRRTAFVNGTARSRPARRTSSTDSFTAA